MSLRVTKAVPLIAQTSCHFQEWTRVEICGTSSHKEYLQTRLLQMIEYNRF